MRKPYYGWWIAGAGALGNALQGGLIFWSMGLYTSAFEDQFQASRARVNLIETFLTVTVNLMSPLVGYLVDRHSARHVVAVGTASMGLGLIVISQAGTLIAVWAAYATLIPLGVLALGVLPSSALISRWFRRRRGLALGLSLTGSSIGGALIPPALTYGFLAHGWRPTLLVAGIAVILIAPLFLKVLVNQPQERDENIRLQDARGDQGLAEADEVDWQIRDLVRTPTLWWQTLISGSLLAVSLGMLANLSLHAKDLEITGQRVALLYSIISVCSLGGKIVFGWLLDQVGLKKSGAVTISLLVASMLVLLTLQNYPGLLWGSLLLGLGMGGVTPLWTNLPARSFGARSVGRALGIMNPLHIPITAPSAPLAGYISDTTGSYSLVFVVYIGLCLLAAVGLWCMRPPRTRNQQGNSA